MAATAAVLPAGAATPTISAYGVYTLRHLGYAALGVPSSVSFVLPANARERRRHWYVLHLHARVTVARDSPPGRAYLSAASGGFGSAQIAIEVPPGGKSVVWSSLGFLDGKQTHVSAGRMFEIRFANFFPYRGIRPGTNALRFSIDRFGAKIASATILPDTAIEYTAAGPANLVVRATAGDGAGRVGATRTVTVTLQNTGDRPARGIRITTGFAGAALKLGALPERVARTLRPGERLSARIAVVPRQPGTSRVFVLVSSTANHPGTELELTTRGRAAPATGSSGTNRLIWVATGLGAVAALLAAAVALRRRRS